MNWIPFPPYSRAKAYASASETRNEITVPTFPNTASRIVSRSRGADSVRVKPDGFLRVEEKGSDGLFAEYPFRVLIVLPTEERRNNLAECLLALTPPIETQVWLTTSPELKNDPLGPVWIRPRDYRETTQSTKFPRYAGRANAYKRQPERDAWVRKHTLLRSLFTE